MNSRVSLQAAFLLCLSFLIAESGVAQFSFPGSGGYTAGFFEGQNAACVLTEAVYRDELQDHREEKGQSYADGYAVGYLSGCGTLATQGWVLSDNPAACRPTETDEICARHDQLGVLCCITGDRLGSSELHACGYILANSQERPTVGEILSAREDFLE